MKASVRSVLNDDIQETHMRDNMSVENINSRYKYWRFRILYSIMFGYAGFYLVRQNFSMAMPSLQSELGYSKTEIGMILSIGAMVYGLGKSLFGLVSDRCDARKFMSLGLFISAILSFFQGTVSSLIGLGILMALNNCFQSMGAPACIRLLAHWFSPKELATKWAFWNMSQQIGAALSVVISGWALENFGWRYIFYFPSIISLILSFFLYERLRDTPESLGLPSVESHQGLREQTDEEANLTSKEIFRQVITNQLVWYMSFSNFFVYFVRMSVFIWAPMFLSEFKGISMSMTGKQIAVYDIAGLFGGVLAGYLSDKIFKGYRGRVGFIYMTVLCACVMLLWKAPAGALWLHLLAMGLVGFLVVGPQILVGVAAADFATKKAASTAAGLTGTVGYIGASVTGYVVGRIVDGYGWDAAFMMMAASAGLSALFFLLTWNHRSKVLDE